MEKVPTRIEVRLVAGELLGLLAAACSGSAEQPQKQRIAESTKPTPVAQPSAKVAAKAPSKILFKNVRVFDGKSDRLTANTSVLVVGNKIEKIGGDIAAPEQATIVDGAGRTLMPG